MEKEVRSEEIDIVKMAMRDVQAGEHSAVNFSSKTLRDTRSYRHDMVQSLFAEKGMRTSSVHQKNDLRLRKLTQRGIRTLSEITFV